MDTGMTDESYGDDYDPETYFYTEVYDDEGNAIADYEGDEDYLAGWNDGYEVGYYNSPAEKAERDAEKFLKYKRNGGTKEEAEVLDLLKGLYMYDEDQEEYKEAWNDYMSN
ncbi:MAG: hypothetical protein K2O69_05080 [Odoribacter sp.]|nr:hypothetical protein [Odoribacter sp.]